MPSTPTDRLRLEQQGLGENVNTWGDDRLNRVIRMIDQGVAGVLVKDVSGASDVTLTSVNYEPDEARNALLAFTGTLTGNINVIVPDAEKIYFVHNRTTGPYTLTVKTASGAGQPIVQTYGDMLYCDGADVYGLDIDSVLKLAQDLADASEASAIAAANSEAAAAASEAAALAYRDRTQVLRSEVETVVEDFEDPTVVAIIFG